MNNKYRKLNKLIKYVLGILISLWAYSHTTVTLNNTDSIILTEMVKISASVTIAYMVLLWIKSIRDLILQLVNKLYNFK